MIYYRLLSYWPGFKVGKMYREDYSPMENTIPLGEWAKNHPDYWEKVSLDKWACTVTEKYITKMREWRKAMSTGVFINSFLRKDQVLLSKHISDQSFYYSSSLGSLKDTNKYSDYIIITDEEWYEFIYVPWKASQKPTKPTYGGEIADFPVEVVEKMLEYQVAQENPKNVSVFESNSLADKKSEGFDWTKTPENHEFWNNVIKHKEFHLFFQTYPKNKSNQVSPLNSNQNDNQIIGSPVLLRLPKAQYRAETITGARVRAGTQKIAIASGQVEHRARAAKA